MTSPTDEQPESKPMRPTLRLSVRALMVVVLLLAVIFGWFVQRAQVQREAVAAILKTGGAVRYDWELLPKGGLDLKGQPKWPKWLIDRVGVDYFGDVVMVDLGEKATDHEMAAVGRFSRLRAFNPSSAKVTDAGLVSLRELTSLEILFLSRSPNVTGASLAHVRDLPRLKHIHLSHVQVGDGDLVYLQSLPKLEWLDLSFTDVGDEGLAHLAGIVGLTRLQLDSTKVTTAGLSQLGRMSRMGMLTIALTKVDDLAPIRPMSQLVYLNLGGTPIDDDGLAAVAGLGALKTINLTNTKVDDAGLVHLTGLDGLTSLDLSMTPVTDAGLNHLSGLAELKSLRLGKTRITDAGLVSLCGLSKLEMLELGQTSVTDAGLLQLACLKRLKSLNAQGAAALTDEGVARFLKVLPSAQVFRKPGRRPVLPLPVVSPRSSSPSPPKGQ